MRLSAATNTRSGSFHINFAAPELFAFSEDDDDPFQVDDVLPRTQMSDTYAFGCLYYEVSYNKHFDKGSSVTAQIHYGTIPFAGKTDLQIWTIVHRGKHPPRLDEPPLTDEAWDIIQRCWMTKPSERPRMKDVVESLTWLMLNR